jgi:hypothetical protein
VLACPNHTRHQWARWDGYIYTLDPDALFDEFKQRGASFVKELSFIDGGLWGFEVTMPTGMSWPSFRTEGRVYGHSKQLIPVDLSPVNQQPALNL